VAIDPSDPGPELLGFLTERHLATLTTLRPDGSPHVVPVGVTYDPATRTARVITSGASAKAGHGEDPRAPRPSQARPGTLHGGQAVVREDAASVADAVERYARRYRQPRENPARVAIEISVDRILGNI
jgi:F420H(2)-dependent biliverdin reductase